MAITHVVQNPPKEPLFDVDQYVKERVALYKKNGNSEKVAAVAAHIRSYAENVLPGILISRQDPIVTRTLEEGENEQ